MADCIRTVMGVIFLLLGLTLFTLPDASQSAHAAGAFLLCLFGAPALEKWS